MIEQPINVFSILPKAMSGETKPKEQQARHGQVGVNQFDLHQHTLHKVVVG